MVSSSYTRWALRNPSSRYLVANGADPMALGAFRAALAGVQLDCRLADRTNEEIDRFLADGHSGHFSLTGVVAGAYPLRG